MTSILIIEDDDKFREMLSLMLESAGYIIQEAPNGEKGLKLFKKNPTDIVITDIFMPEIEGLEVIQTIRQDNPNTKIISISGGGRGGDFMYLEQTLEFGANKCLTKPFLEDELLTAVKEVLKD